MRCRPTVVLSHCSGSRSPNAGNGPLVAVVSVASSPGNGCGSLLATGSPLRISVIRGPTSDSPSHTQGGSRMRESRTSGSVRGALSNERPYRDTTALRLIQIAALAGLDQLIERADLAGEAIVVPPVLVLRERERLDRVVDAQALGDGVLHGRVLIRQHGGELLDVGTR